LGFSLEEKKCIVCQKPFLVKRYNGYIRKREPICCSRSCSSTIGISACKEKKSKVITCEDCKKETEIPINSASTLCSACYENRNPGKTKNSPHLFKLKKTCCICGEFLYDSNKTGYCNTHLKETDYLRNKTLSFIETKGKENNWGWSPRTKGKLSRLELQTIALLQKFDFRAVYKNNYTVTKRSLGLKGAYYSLDFYFPEKRVDLEVNGRTHTKEAIKEKDKKRKEALEKNGYIVYSVVGGIKLEEQVKAFILFYNTIPVRLLG
jgi:hypothetical protein